MMYKDRKMEIQIRSLRRLLNDPVGDTYDDGFLLEMLEMTAIFHIVLTKYFIEKNFSREEVLKDISTIINFMADHESESEKQSTNHLQQDS